MNERGASAQKYGTVDEWCRSRGLGRTTTYNLLKAGKLRAVKCGKRTLIDFEHGDAYMAALPTAYPVAA